MKFAKGTIYLFVSHERSLNKLASLINITGVDHKILLTDYSPSQKKKYVSKFDSIYIQEEFQLTEILRDIEHVDRVICVSEDLLTIAAKIEDHYGINNISKHAAVILSNKMSFYSEFKGELPLPWMVIPETEEELVNIEEPIFIKPDLGTGGKSPFQWGYTAWDSGAAFRDYLMQRGELELFLDGNQKGFKEDRFKGQSIHYMLQQYIDPTEDKIAPVGIVRNGKLDILFYVKMRRSIKRYSSGFSKILDQFVWSVTKEDLPQKQVEEISTFLNHIFNKLQIKEIFFSGPDFTFVNNSVLVNDFNARPGHFMNLLDEFPENDIVLNGLGGIPICIGKHMLWGCADIGEGILKARGDLEKLGCYWGEEAKIPQVGDNIIKACGLQDPVSVGNICVFGRNENELFKNFEVAEKEIKNLLDLVPSSL